MNAKTEFFGNGQNDTARQEIATCPICDGWGVFEKQDVCPYCDKGLIKAESHGWVILAAELSGDLYKDRTAS